MTGPGTAAADPDPHPPHRTPKRVTLTAHFDGTWSWYDRVTDQGAEEFFSFDEAITDARQKGVDLQ